MKGGEREACGTRTRRKLMRISADQLEMWISRREHLVLHSFVYVARIQVWVHLGGKTREGTATDLETHKHTIHASDVDRSTPA